METTNIEKEEQTTENGEKQEEIKRDKTLLIKKILFTMIGVLILFLIILTLLFIFKNDEEELKNEAPISMEKAIEKSENSVENITQEPEIVEKKFDFNNLEPEKLNEQLELLTNKNLEQQREKEQKLLEEEKKLSPVFSLVNNLKDKDTNKSAEETPLAINEVNPAQEIKKDENIDKDNSSILEKVETKKDENVEETTKVDKQVSIEEPKQTSSFEFVKLINVAKIKGDLNKKYLDRVVVVNANILLCRDDENIIELYYGPFLEDNLRADLLSELVKNGFKEAYSLEMTKEEFDKRCNY